MTEEFTYLTDWDWVRLAASEEYDRPVLRAVKATDDRLMATDGVRLHIAPNTQVRPGLWDAATGEVREERFPNHEPVLAAVPAAESVSIWSVESMWAACLAAERFGELIGSEQGYVHLPCPGGSVMVNGRYLANILRGAAPCDAASDLVTITTGGALQLVKVEIVHHNRVAILPPVRPSPEPGDVERVGTRLFDLSGFLNETKLAEVPA